MKRIQVNFGNARIKHHLKIVMHLQMTKGMEHFLEVSLGWHYQVWWHHHTSMVKSPWPSSTIHLRTPINEWYYDASPGFNSGNMSISDRYPQDNGVDALAGRYRPFFLKEVLTFSTTTFTYCVGKNVQYCVPFSTSTWQRLHPKYHQLRECLPLKIQHLKAIKVCHFLYCLLYSWITIIGKFWQYE